MLTNKQKWQQQRAMAKVRNIPFNLTFEQWTDIWQQSGKWDLRGRGHGKYCMSRVGDKGAYEIGNVFIQLHTQNVLDGITPALHPKVKSPRCSTTVNGKAITPRCSTTVNGKVLYNDDIKKVWSALKLGIPKSEATKEKMRIAAINRWSKNKV